ncbi:acylneuraminate cytidylyltransferase family protein [Aureispira anguillae]|uniref:Acylneuraminate cytidylyltransferase family protein n=1 Tax=Aureispira anguillae TaxID=2864201 RepID=A0A915YJJ3_9BACT|nr:acylneuraminate cytidylyltransferase family protein [Aureispira anguillae]BDS14372.1 acylneuraminate cytidylyltransferase family protein [Aureispira anguillae]
MTTSKKSFCFIPAKAASTRLKKKNILPLAGKEMIYYAINNAQTSHLFAPNDIIVSSETKEIQAVAQKYGANVPYDRAEHLAHDPYGIVDVLLDFLERFPNYKNYDSCCILLITAPLTIADDLKKSYQLYNENDFNAVMSVTPTEHSALRSVYVNENNIEAIHPKYLKKKSQELPTTYRLNGAVTWINIAAFLKERTYFMMPWGGYKMPNERSIDIDNLMDYKYAQFLMEN